MSKKNQKLVTPAILRQAVIGSFTKLNPVYMMKNPVMFVVEIGFFITLVLSFFPGLLGDVSSGTNLRAYNMIVCAVCYRPVRKLRRISGGRTGQSAGRQSEKDAEGYTGPSAAGGRHGENRSVQRIEKRRCRHGEGGRDHPRRRRGY